MEIILWPPLSNKVKQFFNNRGSSKHSFLFDSIVCGIIDNNRTILCVYCVVCLFNLLVHQVKWVHLFDVQWIRKVIFGFWRGSLKCIYITKHDYALRKLTLSIWKEHFCFTLRFNIGYCFKIKHWFFLNMRILKKWVLLEPKNVKM